MILETFAHMSKEALGFFAITVTELMVLFIGISSIVAVIQEFAPPNRIKTFLSAKGGRGYFVGAGLGALPPFRSYSTIPTMAFLFSSPLVNPIIVGLFFMAFGLQATVVYSALALLMAIIGTILDRCHFRRFIKWDALDEHRTGCCDPTAAVETGRWSRIFVEAVSQFGTFLPDILFGVAIVAFAYGFVPKEIIEGFAGPDNPFAIPVAAVIVVPLVIGGAGAGIPEAVMLKRIFKGPLLAAFLTAIFFIAVVSGLIFDSAFR